MEERFDQLIVQIRNRNPDCMIVLCTSCPRNDCDVSELNSLLSSLCREHSIQVVEMEKHFCSQEGTPVLRYYGRDKIHLSKSGVRRFLDSIEKTCDNLSLIDNFELCVYGIPRARQNTQHRQAVPKNGRNNQPNQRRHPRQNRSPIRQNRSGNCVKCGETNHTTFDCKHKEQIKCHSCGYLGHKQLKCPNI